VAEEPQPFMEHRDYHKVGILQTFVLRLVRFRAFGLYALNNDSKIHFCYVSLFIKIQFSIFNSIKTVDFVSLCVCFALCGFKRVRWLRLYINDRGFMQPGDGRSAYVLFN
jgi:hypothetical protein